MWKVLNWVCSFSKRLIDTVLYWAKCWSFGFYLQLETLSAVVQFGCFVCFCLLWIFNLRNKGCHTVLTGKTVPPTRPFEYESTVIKLTTHSFKDACVNWDVRLQNRQGFHKCLPAVCPYMLHLVVLSIHLSFRGKKSESKQRGKRQ